MATQRYISTSFWDDAWVQSIDPSEKLLYLYLMTNPLTNIAGIYKITLKRIHDDTGFSVDMIGKILARFERSKKVCRLDEYIIIPKWPKHQKWKEKKTINTGIQKIILELPNSIRSKAKEVGYLYPIDSVPVGYGYEPSYSDSDSDSDIDIDTCGAIDEYQEHTKPKKQAKDDPLFDVFWTAYPRKAGKGQAKKAYASQIRKGSSHELIMERLKIYIAQLQAAKTERQFMRHPATFLNNLDDYEQSEVPTVDDEPEESEFLRMYKPKPMTPEERDMIARSYGVHP
jgi:hypothetical protein